MERAVTAFITLEKDLLSVPVPSRVASEQQSISVFECELRELRTVTLVP